MREMGQMGAGTSARGDQVRAKREGHPSSARPRGCSSMLGEHPPENRRLPYQQPHHSPPQRREPIQQEQNPGEHRRMPHQPPVCRLVTPQVACSKRIRQRNCLLKREAETVTRNRIHRPRRIAGQRRVSMNDVAQAARSRHRAAFHAACPNPRQPSLQYRKLNQGIFQPRMGISRQHGNPHLVRADGCDVNLAARAPMDFHEVGPRRDTVVSAKSDPVPTPSGVVQTRRAANTRILAVGSHHPLE